MRVDPEDMIVTTGGQQVIDLVTKTLIDPGDVVIAEGPTYPGAVPVFSSYQADVVQIDMDADGMRVDLLEETLDRLEREGRRPKFIYTVPSFQNPAGVTMSLRAPAAARGGGARARAARAGGQPVRAAALRGRARPPPLLLARRRRVRDVPRHVLEDPLARHPARLGGGAAAGAREDQPRQAGGRPVHLDAVAADGPGLLRARAAGATTSSRSPSSTARGATRCSTRSPSTSRRQAEWTRPAGGLFIWATLPDFIDTTDLLARALRDNVAFVPGEAAFLDGRGRNSMRLNFSGSDEDAIREGIRRIGEVVTEQVELYGTLTGERPARAAPRGPERPPTTTCCVCRTRAERERRAKRLVSRVAVLKGGRSLERQVSLRSGARVEDALGAARPRGGRDRRRRRPDAASARGAARRGVHRHARARRRGRHGPGAARDPRHPVHRVGRARLRRARWTRCWPST